jgi:signal transduction histidine kinase
MRMRVAGGTEISALTGENLSMTRVARSSATPILRRVLLAPFTRRSWAELGYAIVSLPIALAGFFVTVVPFAHVVLLFVSTPAVRWFGSVNRRVLHRLLGEQVPAPPPMRLDPHLHVTTTEPTRLAALVSAAGGQVRRQNATKVKVTGLTAGQLAQLAGAETVAIEELKPHSGKWLTAAARDVPGWRARAYLVLKLPVSVAMFLAAAGCWLAGLIGLTSPIWWSVRYTHAAQMHTAGQVEALFVVGVAAVLAAPWLTRAAIAADRSLIRSLLGPSLAQRVRDLEQTRARAVDDSAARLRSIERDLHDGAQAQLVGLAMKLGLAKEKLDGAAGAVAPADLNRAVELVDAAHRSAIEAMTELRALARGIHPPVLDNGLADALTTLAARSAVPVELVMDISEPASAAIETIAYFCAAELIANVAKHSEARHATLEAVHVPGLLRVRVTDDGHGGARPEAGSGLRGLADRIRTVDGRMEIDSPRGGPTVVTVELPSHA